MGRRVWRLPVRFSFAANKPGKSRKPSAPASTIRTTEPPWATSTF
jgi:hypothetical protein